MSNKPLVVAIDFGTTYSGYAFSFVHDFQVDPLKITCTNHFHTWSGARMSLKTPICILFSPDEQFHSFGYEAEEKFSDLLMDEEHQAWYYFKRFKMMLFSHQDLKRDTKWQASNGKPFPAIKIFSCAIEYLVNHMLSTMDGKLAGVKCDDVHWVLTVPAICNDSAKHFMRTAAEMAGIKSANLAIALEPETASFYCKYLPVEKLSDTGKSEISCFETGKRYMVVDLGGGKVDITVHEVSHYGHLQEQLKVNSGQWGGTTVDEAFMDFIRNICGQEIFARFQSDFKDDYMDLFREFEVKKRTFSLELDRKVTVKIPIMLHEAFQDDHGKSLRDVIAERHDLQGKLVFAGDKKRLEPSLMISFFEKSVDTILGHLKDMIGKIKSTRWLMLVGGFSELRICQNVLKNVLGKNRFVPNEAGLAVLKGAVIFSHHHKIISSRVSIYSYGISVRGPAQDGERKELLIQEEDDSWMCRSHFSKHVEKIVFMSDPITGEISSSVAEKQVVQALRTATGRQTFSSAAEKHLDLEFREACNGSIIIRFSPKVGKSLQKVKQSCATGKIKDILLIIFMQSGVEYTLGEGDFRWKVSIYKTCIPFNHSAQETAFPVLRMVSEEDVIKDYWNLLVEEIDPWTLLGDLQMKGLVGEEDGNKMLKLDSRKDCVKFLLERLLASEEPDLGYEILLDHCREHNEYVYQKIQATEGQLDLYGHVDKRYQSEQEMLFTATVILSIHRKEKNPNQYGSNMKLEISHLTIQEPICYFDIEAEAPEEESDAADLQKEVVMVLEQVL